MYSGTLSDIFEVSETHRAGEEGRNEERQKGRTADVKIKSTSPGTWETAKVTTMQTTHAS
jgi:hypothetical protein